MLCDRELSGFLCFSQKAFGDVYSEVPTVLLVHQGQTSFAVGGMCIIRVCCTVAQKRLWRS